MTTMKIWDQPADFWLGVGLIAEAPILLINWLVPDNTCNLYFSRFIECPLPIWIIFVVGLISYFLVAWITHKLQLRLGKSVNTSKNS